MRIQSQQHHIQRDDLPDTRKRVLKVLRASIAGLLSLGLAGMAVAGQPYSYYAVGAPNAVLTSPPQPKSNTQSVVLMGGGYDVAEAFRWMIRQSGVQPANCTGGLAGTCAPTTGGRFLILRASGTDAYNPYVFSRLGTLDPTSPYENVGGQDLGLSSVETLIVSSTAAANDPFVVSRVKAAHAIWIAGGNQADYINFWMGTPLQDEINKSIARGVPVGGTSAGNAVLGQYVFAALKGTVTSDQALSDPYNKYMSFSPVLPNTGPSLLKVASLANTITDDHLDTRDRMGRMTAFVARITQNICAGPVDIAKSRAIGLGEETALVVSASLLNGSLSSASAQLVSNPVPANTSTAHPNSAYLLAFTPRNNNISSYCMAGKPLQITSTPKGAFVLTRMTASTAKATTTAQSIDPQPVSNQRVSFVDNSKSLNLVSGALVGCSSSDVSCAVTNDLSTYGGVLYGTSY